MEGGAAAAATATTRRCNGNNAPLPPPTMRILEPTQDYKPNNPQWLADLVAADPWDLPAPPPPPTPVASDSSAAAANDDTSVAPGTPAAAALFALDPSWAYLNHGSYGAALRAGLEAQAFYRLRLEAQPVLFMESEAVAGALRAAAEAAALLGADWRDAVPAANATAGANAVTRAAPLAPGDLVLVADSTYPAVRSCFAAAAARAGASLLEIALPLLPSGDGGNGSGNSGSSSSQSVAEAVAEAYERAAAAYGGRIKLAVVDHIVSFPPFVLPVARIARALRAAGARVLIDGAHAAGALPGGLDVPSLGGDYYVTNLHKWLCTPKGTALLWAARGRQDGLLPPVVSHGRGLGFRGEWAWQGTHDPTAWLSVPACLAQLRRLGGVQALAAHNCALAARAAAMLRARWWGARGREEEDGDNSGGAANAPPPLPLATVRLPRPLALPRGGGADGAAAAPLAATPAAAAALQRHLRAAHRIEVPVIACKGALYCRISAQAYNTLEQYGRLADAISALLPVCGRPVGCMEGS